MSRRRLALTTGQAARYCYVTADTIANWIRSGLLRAQRTAGGQYRILVEDLRGFMVSKGMRVDLLDEEDSDRPLCWAFRSGREGSSWDEERCEGCIVKFLGVLDCFKLMGMHPGVTGARRDCGACEYYRLWGQAAIDGTEARHEGQDS